MGIFRDYLRSLRTLHPRMTLCFQGSGCLRNYTEALPLSCPHHCENGSARKAQTSEPSIQSLFKSPFCQLIPCDLHAVHKLPKACYSCFTDNESYLLFIFSCISRKHNKSYKCTNYKKYVVPFK